MPLYALSPAGQGAGRASQNRRRPAALRMRAGPPAPPPRPAAGGHPPSRPLPLPTPSRLILGTMQFGEGINTPHAHALLDAAFEAGVAAFDTAEMYPVPQRPESAGRSEAALGSWLQAHPGRREAVHLTTKVAGPGGMPWVRGGPPRLDGPAVRAALDASLSRLGTDQVDLLLLHWPDRYVPLWGETAYDPGRAYGDTVPLADVWAACGEAVAAGKAAAVGLSNETAWGLGQVLALAQAGGGPPVAALQNAYSLLARSFEATCAETCAAGGVPLLAYAPLAAGLLTGKYNHGAGFVGGRHAWGGPPAARLNKYRGRYAEGEARYAPTVPARAAAVAYARLAGEAGLSPAALALRWVLGRPQVGGAVVGVTSAAQLAELVDAAGEGGLPGDVLEAVDRIHARWPSPTP